MTKAKHIMTTSVVATAPEASIQDAAKVLYQNHFSGLPVLKEEKVVGVLTERDLLKVMKPIHVPGFLGFLGSAVYLDNPFDGDEVEKQIKEVLATKVGEIMSQEFKMVDEETDIQKIADLFLDENLSLLPVVDQERLVGVITASDLIKVLVQE